MKTFSFCFVMALAISCAQGCSETSLVSLEKADANAQVSTQDDCRAACTGECKFFLLKPKKGICMLLKPVSDTSAGTCDCSNGSCSSRDPAGLNTLYDSGAGGANSESDCASMCTGECTLYWYKDDGRCRTFKVKNTENAAVCTSC